MMRDDVHRAHQQPNLEELLLDLRGNTALSLSAYAEDDDSVTRVLELPQDALDWVVAVNAREQRSLTTEQLRWSLAQGELRPETLVWRRGLPAWQLLGSIAELQPELPAPLPPPPVLVQPPPPPEPLPPTVRRPAPVAPRHSAPVAPRHSAPAAPMRAAQAPRAASERLRVAERAAAPPRVPLAACVPPSAAAPSPAPAPALDSAASALVPAAPLVPPEMDLERLALEGGSLRLKRAVMGVSALAMTGVFVTLFALSSTSEDKVREAARQREAAALTKAAAKRNETTAKERESTPAATDPDDAESEPPRQRNPRERARGVPRAAAAMVLDSEQGDSVEGAGRAAAMDGARQRL